MSEDTATFGFEIKGLIELPSGSSDEDLAAALRNALLSESRIYEASLVSAISLISD